jgi:hypothetical protein
VRLERRFVSHMTTRHRQAIPQTHVKDDPETVQLAGRRRLEYEHSTQQSHMIIKRQPSRRKKERGSPSCAATHPSRSRFLILKSTPAVAIRLSENLSFVYRIRSEVFPTAANATRSEESAIARIRRLLWHTDDGPRSAVMRVPPCPNGLKACCRGDAQTVFPEYTE